MKRLVRRKTKDSSLYSKMGSALVFLLVLLLPTQLGKHFFLPFSYLSGVRVDYLAPTIYIADIIIFLLALFHLHYLRSFLRKKLFLTVLVLLVPAVIFAKSIPLALYQYIRIVEVIIVGAIAYKHALKENVILIALAVTTFIQSVLVFSQLILKHSLQGVFYFLGERYMTLSLPGIAKASLNGVEFLRPYGTFSHPNSMAGFFLVVYIWVLTNSRFNKYSFLKYAVLFLCSVLVFFSFSKIAILAYLLTTFFYLFTTKITCHLCFLARMITLGTASLIFLPAKTDPLTLQKRLELIGNSVRIIFGHPLTGTGLGNYLIAQNQYVSRFPYFFNQPVHNIFLLFFAETGLIFGGSIVIILFRFLKGRLHPRHILVIAAIVITGLFDHYWLTLQQNILLAGYIIGASLRKTD